MKPWLFALLSSFIMAAPSTASAQEFAGREHAHAMLLLNQSDQDIRAAARSLYRTGSSRQVIFDLLAEVAWTACSGNRTMDADTLSWLGKALGNTKQPRYAALLDFCSSNVKDEKTRKYMKLARSDLGDSATTDGSFEGGKMNLQETRARLAKQGNSTPRGQLERKFGDVRKSQGIEEVYSILGAPTEVSSSAVPGQKVGHGFIKVRIENDILVLGYGELGTIRFAFREGSNDWSLTEATSTKGLFWSSREGRFASVNDYLASDDGSQLREVSGHLIERGNLNRDILDRVAERIYKSRDERNGQLADGLAWLCKVIAKSGDGRYRQFLLEVADTAADKKLKTHAGKAASGLKETSKDQFIPALNSKL